MMTTFTYPFLLLLLVPLLTLVILGYRRPAALSASSFAFTRQCLGISILSYAVALTGIQFVGWDESMLTVTLVAQIAAWVFLILTMRGVFEVLAGK